MSSKNRFSILITIGLILSVFVTNVMGENLIKYNEDKDGAVYYYDKDSVKRESGIVEIWDVIKYSGINEDWKNWVDSCINISKPDSNPNCNLLSTVKILNEINCKNNTYRLLSAILYDENGKLLEMSSKQTEIKKIYPNTMIEELKNRVCK